MFNDGGLCQNLRKGILKIPCKARHHNLHLALLARLNETWIETFENILLACGLLRFFHPPSKTTQEAQFPKATSESGNVAFWPFVTIIQPCDSLDDSNNRLGDFWVLHPADSHQKSRRCPKNGNELMILAVTQGFKWLLGAAKDCQALQRTFFGAPWRIFTNG